MSKKTDSADTTKYEELFPDEGEQNDVTSFPSEKRGSSRSVQPAAVSSASKETKESFDIAGDEPDDVPSKFPRTKVPSSVVLDYVTQRLGGTNYFPDVRFDWCVGPEGRRMRFSRRYIDPHVVVDVFNNDTKAVRDEVERKRQIISAHNYDMELMWVEKEEELQNPTSRLTYISRGLVVMGYLPILSNRIHSASFEAARCGEVCSLPEPLQPIQPANTIGTQLGMRAVDW